MGSLGIGAIVLVSLLIFSCVLLLILLKVINRLVEVNRELLIVVAGKGDKPEPSLRALVASAKLPKKKLPGIADKKKKDEDKDKDKNTNYTLEVGVG